MQFEITISEQNITNHDCRAEHITTRLSYTCTQNLGRICMKDKLIACKAEVTTVTVGPANHKCTKPLKINTFIELHVSENHRISLVLVLHQKKLYKYPAAAAPQSRFRTFLRAVATTASLVNTALIKGQLIYRSMDECYFPNLQPLY